MKCRILTSVCAAVLCGAGVAVIASPAEPEPAVLARHWDAVLHHVQRAQGQAAAVVMAADLRLRAARDSAGAYLFRQGESAPRMRGVHVLAIEAADGPEGAETAEETSDSVLSWIAPGEAGPLERIVMLVHGLDEPGRVWDDLAPVLAAQGHRVVRFDYPNDQAIGASAELLGAALRELREYGVMHVDFVCHSMGGLVARDVLTSEGHYRGRATGHEELPAVGHLITLGTPHYGSPWAHLQCISDAAEQVDRFLHCSDRDPRHFLGFLADGRGEAARDLLPGSDYLNELNSRGLPEGVTVCNVVAVIDPVGSAEEDESATTASFFSLAHAGEIRRSLSGRLGDGVVSTRSAQLEGACEVVFVEASHRGMVRRSRLESALRWTVRSPQAEPPAIPIILERLAPPVTE